MQYFAYIQTQLALRFGWKSLFTVFVCVCVYLMAQVHDQECGDFRMIRRQFDSTFQTIVMVLCLIRLIGPMPIYCRLSSFVVEGYCKVEGAGRLPLNWFLKTRILIFLLKASLYKIIFFN